MGRVLNLQVKLSKQWHVEYLYDPGIGQSATTTSGFSHISIRFSRKQNREEEIFWYENYMIKRPSHQEMRI